MNIPDKGRKKVRVEQAQIKKPTGDLERETSQLGPLEESLKERLKFETLLTYISSRFVNVPAEQIDSEIKDSQRRICELLEIDRSTLWQVSEKEPGLMLLTHIHQPPEMQLPPERMNAGDFFPWTVQKVLGGETVTISKIADLPPEADCDRENFLLYGTKSNVLVPLSVGGGPVFGLLTFAVTHEERTWPEMTVMGFKLIAQVFANALARKRADQELRESEARLSLAADAAGAGLWVLNVDTGDFWLTEQARRLIGFASGGEITFQNFLNVIYSEDRERVRLTVKGAMQSHDDKQLDYRIVLPDGTVRWISSRGRPYSEKNWGTNCLMGVSLDITERKQAEEALKDRLRFEELLSNLSARFVNMPPERVDSEIEKGLRQVLEFSQVDRCALVLTLLDKASWQITHIAFSDNVPPVPLRVALPRSLYPWAFEKLADKHEVMSVSSLDDLPAEANVDRQTCIEMGIRSYVNIPILHNESIVHFIHIDSIKSERVWPEEIFPRLRLLGEIFVNVLERKRAEEASRESLRMLRQNESDLRGLAGRLIFAQEEERTRIARELHDDLAQRLAVFAMDVGRLEQHFVDLPFPVREELREMKNSIVRISQDVHSLSRQLHPSILDDLGLTKAVESECARFSLREGIEISFNHENIPRAISKDVSLALYRIIQEGLTNISKHACADHISVSLKGIDHDVLLSIQDDGIGFNWAEVKEKPGLGFSSMRERARLIHGEFSIQSQPKKGTVITVKSPLTKEEE